MRTKKTLAAAALLLAAPLALAGCGGNDTDPAGSSSASSTAFNDADVTFTQNMIPHHEQAVQMAKLAKDRAQSPAVKELAHKIEAAQGPEIEKMQGWLKTWGQDSMAGMDHGGHGGMNGMAGMMDEDDMNMLDQSDAGAFDRMFLKMMIEHHEGAIEMAHTEQVKGENPEAVALAKKIAADQEAEITQMKHLLGA